ncbi:hypothetical protein BUALT_Bualt14G0127700 [Buddleja alternifolia]|uniref:Pentatricopeptide repeat-containing protein n=1 Tax=Buddleja alternifolia TaxID=168488 RepID=A0AAV6WHC5_9LAMI|nr:hypothetical protein BUALT_Bualt14G0127700 [Buddleja alternifolia]
MDANCGKIKDVYIGSALVDMDANCGKIKIARCLFDRIPNCNLVCWNVMLGANSMHGKARETIEIFHLMQKCGQKPDPEMGNKKAASQVRFHNAMITKQGKRMPAAKVWGRSRTGQAHGPAAGNGPAPGQGNNLAEGNMPAVGNGVAEANVHAGGIAEANVYAGEIAEENVPAGGDGTAAENVPAGGDGTL